MRGVGGADELRVTSEHELLTSFRSFVRSEGARLYRDLPWRNTRDPYAVWISEVMLQQTQVPRVQTRWGAWLEHFPSVFALAEASAAEVLGEWQGLGYNRRALALKSAAEIVVNDYDGVFPTEVRSLTALPGIGPATAQGIRAFAFNLPGVYLETNVRAVFLHHLYPDAPAVPDRELIDPIERTCPGLDAPYAQPQDDTDTPQAWYWALLDYGAELKRLVPNPSRRSRSYAKQSRFEGSRRQKRAEIVRILLAAQGQALDLETITAKLNQVELLAARPHVGTDLVQEIMADLSVEGFCVDTGCAWTIA
ncbi:adenine glycosylase [Collinsella sp. AGMB00827]|uniref:Adenine glycosylase n=2 Tax=Collinsella ureilytica TaxID=2869515 RepID=A0ABS7MJR3_9ACTN|nr:adenine glycosylase [Collinsella urealyticum]